MVRLAAAFGVLALALAGGASADGAEITVPGDMTVEAQDASGAVVTFAASAVDEDGNAVTVACQPASGSRFPLGETEVTCTADEDEEKFKVTVVDTTPPTLVAPDVTEQATSPSGAVVRYALPFATDAVDPTPSVACDPPPGRFPLGTTTVRCSGTDDAGNVREATFTVSVVDTDAPRFSGGPEAVVEREANGPDGSVVAYPLPTATDATSREPLPVTCAPPPQTTFPLGETTVTCAATDAAGNRGELTFTVVVKDTTPPTLTVPAALSVTASSAAGAPATDAAIAAFLAGAAASDLVTATPVVTHDAPPVLPIGATRITFAAADAAGNTATASSLVTVLAPSTGSAPPAAPSSATPVAVPDRTPPGAVRSLRVAVGDRRVRLTWAPPADPDFDRVSVLRSAAASGAQGAVTVYTGRETTFEDRGLRNGVEYRYVLVGYDRERNASPAVAAVATPKARLLFAPLDGARIRKPPMLVWRAVPRAAYYNVQLFRGRTKILSAWPTRPRLLLRESWRYGGKQRRLAPGVYRWYVWPGFGARRAARYGQALGQATFVRVRAGSASAG